MRSFSGHDLNKYQTLVVDIVLTASIRMKPKIRIGIKETYEDILNQNSGNHYI